MKKSLWNGLGDCAVSLPRSVLTASARRFANIHWNRLQRVERMNARLAKYPKVSTGFAAALVAKQSPAEGRVSEDPESIATMIAKVRNRRRLVSLLLIPSPDDGPDD
jgi:hypothetical protein